MAYIGLHNHTHYSNFRLRDSTNKVPQLIDYVHSLGHKGIAITEHECVSSAIEVEKYVTEKKKLDESWDDFKYLLGNEIYLCNSNTTKDNQEHLVFPHFVLNALDAKGHGQIRKLSTIAWSHSFMRNRMMRVPTFYEDLQEILLEDKGHLIGQTACIGGQLPKYILEEREGKNTEGKIEQWIEWMRNLFADGCFFLELQPSENEEQIYVNKELVRLSGKYQLPYIITTDSHYLNKDVRFIHKIFLNAQEGDREVDDFYATTYCMSEEEIHSYMDESLGKDVVQHGIDNSMLIYDKAEEYSLLKPLKIPYISLDNTEPNKNLFEKYKDKMQYLEYFYKSEYPSDRHMLREILKRMDGDTQYQNEEFYKHMDICFKSIIDSSEKMGVRWSAYMVNVKNLVDIAWNSGSVVGAARGSGVGFGLLNVMGITQINPLREKTMTYPWRFLNPERASVLDIDTDIQASKREQVIQGLRDTYGKDRISKVLTLSTEQGKSAIYTSARGLEIDNDVAAYLASMVVADRGMLRTLKQMYYGDDEFTADPVFKKEIDNYPELRDVAFGIEGLISGTGSHAGGIILTDEPFTDTTALMKTNSGDVITQFDLHMCEDCSLIKFDLLSVDSLDRIDTCLRLLLKDKKIEWQGTMRDTYEKYIGVYTLERSNKAMWKMFWDHKVISFFQMEKQSGVEAVALTHPESVDDLATINSVMRLMPEEPGAEPPLQKYARFKKNIYLWYKEMSDAGLTQDEQDLLKPILSTSYGICEAQEHLFLLVMLPEAGGFSLGEADKLRKAVAKKNPAQFKEWEKIFFERAKEKKLSQNFVNYIWNILIKTQRGYSFNLSHTLSYSIEGLQELNLAWKYPIIYWDCANLICDSGSIQTDEDSYDNDDTTKYGKIAATISAIKQTGINVALPLINSADYGFIPDEKDNQIIYSLKAINGIGNDCVEQIIKNRPYKSFDDFIERMINTKLIKTSQMIKLIKAGCFTELDNKDRRITMESYLKNCVAAPKTSLTYANFAQVQAYDNQYHIIPDGINLAYRHKKFSEYVLSDFFKNKDIVEKGKKIPKCGYHDRAFLLDDASQTFFNQYYPETIKDKKGNDINVVIGLSGDHYLISEKVFKKINEEKCKPLADWLASPEAADAFNKCQYKELLNKYAQGTVPHWEMDSLSFYSDKHELEHFNDSLYGISNFFVLSEEPEPYDTYTRVIKKEINGMTVSEEKTFPKYQISRIAGAVLDINKLHSSLTLLTKQGCVMVKMNKGQFINYNKTISEIDSKGIKTVVDKSWFSRGNLLMICGYRKENQFRAYRYSDTIYKHVCSLITEINEDGTAVIETERRNNG